MYLLLLLGENKDKSINPFFIVATMPNPLVIMLSAMPTFPKNSI
jgi:hypothetical protein